MSDGTLLELVSRGKKDAYFTQDPQRTWFATDYNRRTPAVQEYVRQEIHGGALFGQLVEVQIPARGDILTNIDIRITLPTWLPPAVAVINRSNGYTVQLLNGEQPVFCGWTNNVGHHLLTRWALVADNMVMMEGTGEFNSIYRHLDSDQFRAPLMNDATAAHDGSVRAIQWNATPPELSVRIPIFGCQSPTDCGFPIVAGSQQRYVLRLWFASKTELVETVSSTGERVSGFTPWDLKTVRVSDPADNTADYTSLTQTQMGAPHVYAVLHYAHVADDLRQAIIGRQNRLYFRDFNTQSWILSQKEWQTGNSISRTLDIPGLFQALILRFRYTDRRRQGAMADSSPVGVSRWIRDLTFNVNGEPLVQYNANAQYPNLLNAAKFRRDVRHELYYVVFGIEADGLPAGTLNITETRSNRCLLIFTPNAAAATGDVELTVFGVSWNVLNVEAGRSKVLFYN